MSEGKAELIDWIVDNVADFNDEPLYTKEYLKKLSGRTLLDMYLECEGIIGYTDLILETVEQAFEVDLNERKFIEDWYEKTICNLWNCIKT